jgi:hydrophobe/amphiphile efflux-3 (HAE3) family protein
MNYWLIKYRLIIIIVSLGISILSLLLFPRLKINPDLDSYLPEHSENIINTRKLDSIFGSGEMIMVLLEGVDVVTPSTLERFKVLTEELGNLEGIDRCISPFDAQQISTLDGFIQMDPILNHIPSDPEALALLKEQIKNNRMASRFFAVDDFSVVSMVLLTDSQYSDDLLIKGIQDVIKNHPGPEEVLLGGMPYIRYSISQSINHDLSILLPVAILLMVVMLYISFKEWKGILMPFIIVIMSMMLSFGVMALLGWQISLITVLMPIMLIAIANDYGIHMITLYQELARSKESLSMVQICIRIYRELRRPIIITGLTTIGGILGLLTHKMIPAAQIGLLAAIGIAFSLILSIWFLPALLSYFEPVTEPAVSAKMRKISADRWLRGISRMVTTYPRQIVLVSALVGAIGVAGIFFIRIDTNIEGYFLGRSQTSRAIKLINDKLGGSQFISILFDSEVLSPEILSRMDSYEQELQKDPVVGGVNSPVTLVKELSKGFYYENEAGFNQIPATTNEIYQSIEIFSMAGNENTVEQFLDYNYENSRLLISLKDGSNNEGKRLLKKMQEMTKDDPNVAFITGSSLTKIELADMVIGGQIRSLILAMVVVFILIAITFKSYRAGLLSVIPLSLAILVLFGLMGFFGITLDIATALISSIMIGVGIDYTIHFLWRFKKERSAGADHREAAYISLTTAGRGIIINALSVIIGFLALTLSNFAPLRFFGGLVVISITTCLISALVLIPAIVVLVKPRFLEKNNSL